MLKIKIDSEFPNGTKESKKHEKVISEFKTAVRTVLKDYSGELEFVYISQFGQFDIKASNTNHDKIKQSDINKIEKLMPNCWI
ncbi:hypothetical protein [Gelidibacter japonicus]|uniref:hypothetical protein n=1 Tax=Gelidibacter japonicus TaxID=1962232 RepID=UPI003A950293